jgi:hypothetical protein
LCACIAMPGWVDGAELRRISHRAHSPRAPPKHERDPTRRRSRIDRTRAAENAEIAAALTEFLDKAQHCNHPVAEPIKPRDNAAIALPQLRQSLGETRAIITDPDDLSSKMRSQPGAVRASRWRSRFDRRSRREHNRSACSEVGCVENSLKGRRPHIALQHMFRTQRTAVFLASGRCRLCVRKRSFSDMA